MAILNKTDDIPVNPIDALSNIEMMNILEEIAVSRFNIVAKTFGEEGKERVSEIANLFTTSMFVVDPHLSLNDEEISLVWKNMFERSRDSRQFLISVHSHFVTLVTEANYLKLIQEKAKSLFAFKPNTFFNTNNVVLDNEEDFIDYLRLYPWFATYLLLGDVLASSVGLSNGAN